MQTTKAPKLKTKRSKISYAKWGYVFIAPFFLAYALFHFAPQLLTIYNSFFENYRDRKSTRLNSSHVRTSRMPSSA